VGGSGGLTDALRRRLESDGGRVVLGDGAARLLVGDGHVTGVETVSGRRVRADAVLAACHIGATRALAGAAAPPALADADPPLGNGFGLVVRALTDSVPTYPGVAPALSAAGLQLLCTDRRDLAAAHGDWAAGRLPRNPVPLAMSFSATDDTLAPAGQHVVTIWGQWYPYDLADGADWDVVADAEAARLVAAVDRYAPGFAQSVQRLYVQTPLALERELSLPRGNVMHVEMGLASMFGFRPTPALSGYTVPGLPGLYLAGASTHPGGGVAGHSGRTAAGVLLADRRRPARARRAVGAALHRTAGRVRR
jgi:phytoene dehydrogenase-like protein